MKNAVIDHLGKKKDFSAMSTKVVLNGITPMGITPPGGKNFSDKLKKLPRKKNSSL